MDEGYERQRMIDLAVWFGENTPSSEFSSALLQKTHLPPQGGRLPIRATPEVAIPHHYFPTWEEGLGGGLLALALVWA